MNTAASIKLRPATADDSEFVYQTKKESLGDYVRSVWGWDEHWQQKYHRDNFNPAMTAIITLDEKDIGYIIEAGEPEYVNLVSIHILPEFQNRGIGTMLIEEMLARAAAAGRAVRLHVLKINPATALYKRLKFRIIGETDNHYVMEWQPPKER
jgi:ribosomal protein S18 acetylase RimI-like enzyme